MTGQPRDGHNGSAIDALLESASSISTGLVSRTCPIKPTLQRVDRKHEALAHNFMPFSTLTLR